MRKFYFLLAVCFALAALPASAGNVSAKFADLELSNGALDTQSPIHLNEDIDIIFEMGGAMVAPKYTASNGQVIVSQLSVVKFVGRTDDVNITEIVLTSPKKSLTFSPGAAECIPAGTFTIDKEAFTNTWTDPVGANIVQITNTTGSPYFVSVSVAYSGGTATGGDEPEPGDDPEPTPDLPGDFENVFSSTFDSATDFAALTVINVNSSSATWRYDKTYECAYIDNDMGTVIPKDDYLVTPALNLKAGHTYRVSFRTWVANPRFPEKICAVIGQEVSAEGLSRVIVDETVVDYATAAELGDTFTVPADGVYYVALHAVSAPGQYRLYADDFVVSRGVQSDAPAEITDFLAIPDPDGALKVTLSLTAPATTMGGNPLESLDSVVIKRAGVTIAKLPAQPGQKLTCVDAVDAAGSYQYTATAASSAGKGIDAAATAWIGIAPPASPLSLDVEELEPGKLKFTWKSVTTNVHGHQISPSQVRYAITVGGSSRAVAQDIVGSEAIVEYPGPGAPQDITSFTLKASTAAGAAARTVESPVVAVGTPYAMPYAENFPGGQLTTDQVAEVIPDERNSVARWGYFEQMVLDDILPVAPDGGMMVFTPYSDGDSSTFRTGKIAVDSDAANPYLSFHYFAIPGAGDSFKVAVDADTLATVSLGAEARGWQEVLIPLESYKGKTVRISLTAFCVDADNNICVDNLLVASRKLADLSLSRVRIPYELTPGADHKCSIRVTNPGINTASSYTLSVTAGDSPVWTATGTDLKRGATHEYEFVYNPGFGVSGDTPFEVALDYPADESSVDNSVTVTAAVTPLSLPSATNLAVTRGTDGYLLTWDAVDVASLPVREVTEGFESYDEFVSEGFGEWTLIDGDGCAVLGIRDGYHSYPGMFEPMAFMVFNNHDGFFPRIGTSSFDPYEGGQYLISASVDCINSNDRSNDDWLISPRLSGNAQTISFFARSSGMVFPENIKVMASASDNLTTSFVEVASYERLSSQWTEYEVSLPAGTNYFAIRNVSYDQYILFIDNITFEAAPLSVTVTGYDVYAGSGDEWEPLNSEPLTSPSFAAEKLDTDKKIRIATRYSNGYVAMSEPFAADASGVGSVIYDREAAPAVYFDLHGIRLPSRPTAPGLYIERRGGETRKIII